MIHLRFKCLSFSTHSRNTLSLSAAFLYPSCPYLNTPHISKSQHIPIKIYQLISFNTIICDCTVAFMFAARGRREAGISSRLLYGPSYRLEWLCESELSSLRSLSSLLWTDSEKMSSTRDKLESSLFSRACLISLFPNDGRFVSAFERC